MKKIKWIMLVLVLMLGLIGGAYAAWTTEVVATGTVETGEVNVQFNNVWVTHRPAYMTSDDVGWGFNDWPDKKDAWFTISNLYPQADDEDHLAFGARFNNTGSIPVKLDEVQLTRSTGPIWNYLKCKVTARDADGNVLGVEEGLLMDLAILIEGAVGDYEVPVGNEVLGLGVDEDGPGSINIWLDESAPDSLQNQTFTFSFKMIFKQANLD
jgi:hypothetical protein